MLEQLVVEEDKLEDLDKVVVACRYLLLHKPKVLEVDRQVEGDMVEVVEEDKVEVVEAYKY
jgi:hypothetical protein